MGRAEPATRATTNVLVGASGISRLIGEKIQAPLKMIYRRNASWNALLSNGVRMQHASLHVPTDSKIHSLKRTLYRDNEKEKIPISERSNHETTYIHVSVFSWSEKRAGPWLAWKRQR